MSVPTWEQYMTPSLRVLSDGEVHRLRHIVEAAADLLGVAPEQRKILNPFGQEQYLNRGQWALSYLVSVKAVERPMRGNYRITDLGRKLLDQYPNGLTAKDLQGLPGYPDAESPHRRDPRAPQTRNRRFSIPKNRSRRADADQHRSRAAIARTNHGPGSRLSSRLSPTS